jgi:segregation and condensation protein A
MDATQKFEIETPVFKGPLELLLELIEKRKLLINDISLAQVTDDYIAYIKQFESFPVALSANFILVASTLLLIKSKSLLPSLSLTDEESMSIEDLEHRLKLYKRIKELSLHVKAKFGTEMIFLRSETRTTKPVFSPHTTMTVSNIFAALKDVVKNFPKPETLPRAIVKKVISLEETIMDLTKRVQSSLKMSFREFSRFGKEDKVNVIVSFLAMLELVKQGIINVTQDGHFKDIHMETEEVGVPRYGN